MTDKLYEAVKKAERAKANYSELKESEIKQIKKIAKKKGVPVEQMTRAYIAQKNTPLVNYEHAVFTDKIAKLGFKAVAGLKYTQQGIIPKIDFIPISEREEKEVFKQVGEFFKEYNKQQNVKG